MMEIVDNGKHNKILVNTSLNGRIRVEGDNNEISTSKDLKNIDLLIQGNNNKINISENVTIFRKLNITISDNNCYINIDENTTIFESTILISEDKNFVNIGKDCMISDGVKILASDSHSIVSMKNGKCINYHKKGINIGNHVWIGMGAMILKNSQIGNNSVIAAGAVVSNKNKIDNIIIGGNPAKIIKKDINWERKTPEKVIEAKEVSLSGKIEKAKINYFIETDLTDKDTIKHLDGWAYVEKLNSIESEIYFEINGKKIYKCYKTIEKKREDLKNIFGQEYENSGFSINFPQKIVLKNIKNINIIIKNKEKLYKTIINL